MSGPAFPSHVGICATGSYKGDIEGLIEFSATSLVPTTDTPMTGVVLLTCDVVIHTHHGMSKMLSGSHVKQIANLLSLASSAHHTYEKTILQGVYDQEWSVWYANFIIKHGLPGLLGRMPEASRLGQYLSEIYETYEQAGSTQHWTDYTARKIAETCCLSFLYCNK